MAVKRHDLQAVLAFQVGGPDTLSRVPEWSGLPDSHTRQGAQGTGRPGAMGQEPGLSSPLDEGAVATVVRYHRLQPVQCLDSDRKRFAQREVNWDLPRFSLEGVEDMKPPTGMEDYPPAIRRGVPAIPLGEGVRGVDPQIAAVWFHTPHLGLLPRPLREPRTEIRGEDDALPDPAGTGQTRGLSGKQTCPVFLPHVGHPHPIHHAASVALPLLRATEIWGSQHRSAVRVPICGRGRSPRQSFQFAF